MKKFFCLLTVLGLICALAGCMNTQDPYETTDPTGESGNPSQPTRPDSHEPAQEPMYAVSVPATSDVTTAKDGTVIFTYTHQSMSLTLPNPDIANKVITNFRERIDKTRTTANSLLSSAKDAYTGVGFWNPYLYSVTYSPSRIDQGVLSLSGSSITFNGFSHPERLCMAANYDLVTGDYLTLASIMTAQASRSDFCRLVLEVLDAVKDEKYLREGYEDTVRQRFEQDETTDENWYFTQDGLCFFFAPYEIAPYSSGVITAQIPYEKLTGILYDAYFPAERDASGGTLQAGSMGAVNLTDFNQIAEALIDPNGEMVFLYAKGLVWDVLIDVGAWDYAENDFVPSYTALASHTLSPGDAVMIQTQLTSGDPTLRMTCYNGTQTVIQYLKKDQATGAVILTDR